MTRKLLRHIVTIATGLSLAATMFLGVGWWRRSEDTKWCRHAAAIGMVAGDRPFDPDVDFDASNREDQDRFVNACLFAGQHEAG